MKILENYGVVALDSNEMKKTDGGTTPYMAARFVLGLAIFCTGFKEGWNERKR